MLLDSKKYSYEDDISEEQELTFKYFNEICDDNYLPHEERNMKSLRMINKDGLYTNLALLMEKDKEAFEFANNIVKNESLKCIEKELYNKKNNSIAKIYVIKNR